MTYDLFLRVYLLTCHSTWKTRVTRFLVIKKTPQEWTSLNNQSVVANIKWGQNQIEKVCFSFKLPTRFAMLEFKITIRFISYFWFVWYIMNINRNFLSEREIHASHWGKLYPLFLFPFSICGKGLTWHTWQFYPT